MLKQEKTFCFKLPISEGTGHSQAQVEVASGTEQVTLSISDVQEPNLSTKYNVEAEAPFQKMTAQTALFPAPVATTNSDDPSHPCKLG